MNSLLMRLKSANAYLAELTLLVRRIRILMWELIILTWELIVISGILTAPLLIL